MKSSLVILFLVLCSTASLAQLPCGNPTINFEEIARVEASPPAQRAVSNMIRVYFHILKNDDGTSAAASLSEIQQEFQQLQTDFAPNNICFVYMGVDSINSSFLNTAMDADNPTHYNIMGALNVPNCLNIYYVFNLPNYGGNAFQIPNNFCVVGRSSMVVNDRRTVSHEVGHCLGLMHTFETAFGEENINGSNCSTLGDRVCDTQADPLSHRAEVCFSFSSTGCLYTGFCVDPNGAVNFNPPYNNIMSYWGTRNCMITNFTAGQFTRMNTFLATSAILLPTLSPYDQGYGPVAINSGSSMQSAVNELYSTGGVQLGGSARATLQARRVRLTNGFRANPSAGKVIITAAICNF